MGGAARASSLVRTQPRLLAPVAGATGTDLANYASMRALNVATG